MTICSEQYILDKTIFSLPRYESFFLPVAAEYYFFAFSTSSLAWNLFLSLTHTTYEFFNDLQLIYQTGSLG